MTVFKLICVSSIRSTITRNKFLFAFFFSVTTVLSNLSIADVNIEPYFKENMASRCDQNSVGENGDIEVVIVPAVSHFPIVTDTPINQMPVSGCDLNVTGTAGEYEPASFVLRAKNNYKNLKIMATDLKGTNGHVLAENIDLKLVKVWYQAKGAWSGIGRPSAIFFPDTPVAVPELLLNDQSLVKTSIKDEKNFIYAETSEGKAYHWKGDTKRVNARQHYFSPELKIQDAGSFQPVSLEKNKNQQFWLTIKLPDAVAAGNYQGW